ncbi:hypothetical protein [uncultured Gammaproteobacteria bacterium]|nr:hypothetical protein [uncultured Gammaproteobacteria bacterium]
MDHYTHLKNPNDPKYRIICADLIKLGVLFVFLWMQDLNGVSFWDFDWYFWVWVVLFLDLGISYLTLSFLI